MKSNFHSQFNQYVVPLNLTTSKNKNNMSKEGERDHKNDF